MTPERQPISMNLSHNKHDKEAFTILAFYKFVDPHWEESHVQDLRSQVEQCLREHEAFGNILLGTEGINGTICYPSFSTTRLSDDAVQDSTHSDAVYEYMQNEFPGIRLRVSFDVKNVFHRLKIRIKKEIVTLGVAQVNPCQKVGTYVPPGPQWHELLQDPDTLVIDTRNNYEVQLGTFQNAINPETTSFVEFPAWFDDQIRQRQPKRVAMFCTG